MAVKCPSCDRDDFASRAGMRRHHATVHGESLVQEGATCEQCGAVFQPRPGSKGRFCSSECHKAYQRRERIEHTCPVCEGVFEAPAADDRTYCSQDCVATANRDQVQRTCAQCGRLFRTQPARDPKYCCRACESEARSTRPRPDNAPMLLWLLYVYEGYNLNETFRRQRAVRGVEDALRKDDVSDALDALGVKQEFKGNPAEYEKQLAELSPDAIGDATPEGDDNWQQYARPEGGDA